MRDDIFLMWLSRINGLSIKKQQQLIDLFHSAENVFLSPRHLLRTLDGLTDQNIHSILSSRNKDDLLSYQKWLDDKHIKFISKFSHEFPTLLGEIPDPPLGIYVLGRLPDDDIPKVSIIGTRKSSEYGITVAYKLSKDLAAQGLVIVSGMAKGIDGKAHKGAVDGGGCTIAVLGCGVDICYPSEHMALREEIIKNGCIISEYPPGTKPIPAYFPARNRIISGLSLGTVVIEARERSGTFITVDEALDQGREVMAVPGNIISKLSEGTNNLLKEGATIVTSYEDVLNALNLTTFEDNSKETNNNILDSLAPEEKLIYDCISFEPITVDEIINKVSGTAKNINGILTILEIDGHIKCMPGQRFIRSL